MQTGIYEDLSFDQYVAIDAVNASRLSLLAMSPAHYRAASSLSPSRALTIGSIVHCGRLEPMQLAARYAVEPDFAADPANCDSKGNPSDSQSTKWVRQARAEWREQNADKEIVPADWYTEAVAVAEGLWRHEGCNQLLNAPGPTEVTAVWVDDATGLKCKARIDKLCDDAIVDLKTTPVLTDFPKSVVRYGYHRQMAHYQAGIWMLTGKSLPCWLAAVEKQPPHCAHAAPIDADSMAEGRRERNELMQRLAECTERNRWPGPDMPAEWRLPEWKLNQQPVTVVVGGIPVEV